ncbi:hypothetical protein ACFPOA_07250 [Lysobacter niabensis]|uniref:hypothetical protein n=1 Tax=Agrilutibacter niabensis TaxID=380628 RepID=UPI00361FD2B0
MNTPWTPPRDSILLSAVLRIAYEECTHGNWSDLEPALAAAWERLRGPTSPHWEDVAERVRASCSEDGVLH